MAELFIVPHHFYLVVHWIKLILTSLWLRFHSSERPWGSTLLRSTWCSFRKGNFVRWCHRDWFQGEKYLHKQIEKLTFWALVFRYSPLTLDSSPFQFSVDGHSNWFLRQRLPQDKSFRSCGLMKFGTFGFGVDVSIITMIVGFNCLHKID